MCFVFALTKSAAFLAR